MVPENCQYIEFIDRHYLIGIDTYLWEYGNFVKNYNKELLEIEESFYSCYDYY
jgi:hypothetical protein